MVHAWNVDKARVATNLLGLRKQYSFTCPKVSTKNIRNYHVARPCPIKGCLSVVERMSPHPTGVHKIQKKSNTLYMYLRQARTMFKNSKYDQSESESDVEVLSDESPMAAAELNNSRPIASVTDFQKWLMSVDGGSKRSADQHKSQISVIIEQIRLVGCPIY
jgi:hypothetical protein